MNYRFGALFIASFLSGHLFGMNPGQIKSATASINSTISQLRRGTLTPDDAQNMFNDAQQKAMSMQRKGIQAPLAELNTAFQEYQNGSLRADMSAANRANISATNFGLRKIATEDLLAQANEAQNAFDRIKSAQFRCRSNGLMGALRVGDAPLIDILRPTNNWAIDNTPENAAVAATLKKDIDRCFTNGIIITLQSYNAQPIPEAVKTAIKNINKEMADEKADMADYALRQPAGSDLTIINSILDSFEPAAEALRTLAIQKRIIR